MILDDLRDSDKITWRLRLSTLEKAHDRVFGSEYYKRGYMDGYDDAIKIVDSIPPADVEPVRRGAWIEEETLWDDRYWTCSVCRESWYLTDDGTPEDHDMRYCPHCGARMEGKTNDDD